MTNTRPQQTPERRNAFTRFLDTVEWLGNFLPHPVTLFAILAVGIVFLSGFLGWIGLAVEDPRPADAHGVAKDGMIRAVRLLNGDGGRMIFTNLVTNFPGFAPVGVVLVPLPRTACSSLFENDFTVEERCLFPEQDTHAVHDSR